MHTFSHPLKCTLTHLHELPGQHTARLQLRGSFPAEWRDLPLVTCEAPLSRSALGAHPHPGQSGHHADAPKRLLIDGPVAGAAPESLGAQVGGRGGHQPQELALSILPSSHWHFLRGASDQGQLCSGCTSFLCSFHSY